MKSRIILTVIKLVIFIALTVYSLVSMAQDRDRIITRTVKFSYDGYDFTDVLTFNYSDYAYYKSLPKNQEKKNYATEHDSHPYLLELAKVLDEDANQLGYTNFKLAEYLTAFVQQAVPYKPDPWNNGLDYPKFPIESLVEQGEDCEGKAAMLVALLNVFGFDAVLVSLPGHMAAALSCSNCGGYYTHNGKKYSFIETTNSGWCIGCVPPEYSQIGATILDVPKPTVYKRSVIAHQKGKLNDDIIPFELSEESIKNYFDSNKNNLDPIEGIYSISSGNLDNDFSRVFIIKDGRSYGGDFIEYIIRGDGFVKYSKTADFTRVQSSNVYLSNQKYPDGSWANYLFVNDGVGLLEGKRVGSATDRLSYLKLYPVK